MDQHDGSRGSGQAPAKDFLALTHGQEWVNFYESFDKLVQDHLSRSSELLRRAMSLPEVADREVAQVRAEMEGKIAAERERSHTLLSQLRDEISASHTQVATLAESVQSVASDLSGLSARVSEALASLDLPLPTPAAESAAPALDAVVESAPALNGVADTYEPVAQDWAPPVFAAEAVIEEETQIEAVAEVAAEEPTAEAVEAETESEPEPHVPEWAAPAAEELAEATAPFEPDTALDLTAMAEAESVDEPVAGESDASSGTGLLDAEPVGVGADRPRPHWLSVTRIGSRS